MLRRIAALVAVALLVSACSEDKADPPDYDPASQQVPPVLANTGEDWPTMLASIGDYENWVFAHPDPQRVDDYMDPKCPCSQVTKEKLSTLRDHGWRFEGSVQRFRDVAFVRRQGNTVDLYVVIESTGRSIVDKSGKVVEKITAGSVPHTVVLERGLDDRWRILSIEALNGVTTTHDDQHAK